MYHCNSNRAAQPDTVGGTSGLQSCTSMDRAIMKNLKKGPRGLTVGCKKSDTDKTRKLGFCHYIQKSLENGNNELSKWNSSFLDI